jgi:hypothetical protein
MPNHIGTRARGIPRNQIQLEVPLMLQARSGELAGWRAPANQVLMRCSSMRWKAKPEKQDAWFLDWMRCRMQGKVTWNTSWSAPGKVQRLQPTHDAE